jgi:molybdopterin/thiamine biosynthesis adenylyltransferase
MKVPNGHFPNQEPPRLTARAGLATFVSLRRWHEVPEQPGDRKRVAANLDHSARLPSFIGAPDDAIDRLQSLSIAFVGAGSVASHVIEFAAQMGINEIWICDPKKTKVESLLTHPIRVPELNKNKAELMARRAKGRSPGTRVRYFPGYFQELPPDALADADVVIIASDTISAEVAVAESCIRLGKPLIQGSVYGAALVAQTRLLLGSEDASGPCLCCSLSPGEWEDLDRDTKFSCDGSKVSSASPGSATPEPTKLPTVSPPHLCAQAATMVVGELLRHVLELGPRPEAGGRSITHAGFTGQTSETKLARNSGCVLEHSSWSVRASASALTQLTPRDLARIAGNSDADLRATSLRVHNHRFASLYTCGCEPHSRFDRFIADGQSLDPCEACGHPRDLHPLHSFAEIPFSALDKNVDRSLADLGVRDTPTVLVQGPNGTTLVRSPGHALPRITSSISLNPATSHEGTNP